jgi:HEAT repeat protein
MPRATRRAAPLLLALAAAVLAACSNAPSGPGSGARTGTPLTPSDPRLARFEKVDALITQWDAAQAEGRPEQAESIFALIRAEVDSDFASFAEASSGSLGIRPKYLATGALGFSGRPEATALLVERLAEQDARLVGNALVAVKLRADPATPLPPILRLIPANAPDPRRYAPLALAEVLDARARAGVPRDEPSERSALNLLSGGVADRDPYVRLHVAKALGAIPHPASDELLAVLLKDEHIRIRVAAAAALERHGSVAAFPSVIRVLDEAPEESRPIVRDILASYAGRLLGSPLPEATLATLGTSGPAWDRWYREQFGRAASADLGPPPAALPPATPGALPPPAIR